MNSFSNSDLAAPLARSKPVNQAARLQALVEEHEADSLVSRLKDIYAVADSLVDNRHSCRRCARCCDQTIRPLAAYAVEIAGLSTLAPADHLPLVDEDAPLCPALNSQARCEFYLSRPLGCRLFWPWKEWTSEKGCANYPHRAASIDKMREMLGLVDKLNHEFVRATGLHRDFDFDYLAHWSITTWFAPLAAVSAKQSFAWGS